jgi:hypothetical protein
LIDWESEVENRAYVSRYAAENILNWRVERINGRNITTLVALLERGMRNATKRTEDDGRLEIPTAVGVGNNRCPLFPLLDDSWTCERASFTNVK